jgi:hypothetical protein
MDEDAFDVWLRVPARPENVALARQALAGLCEALPTSAKVLADVKLAVTEACTNCVVHAYPNGLGDGAVFEVEAERHDHLGPAHGAAAAELDGARERGDQRQAEPEAGAVGPRDDPAPAIEDHEV